MNTTNLAPVVAVLNMKGGVGKTTISAHVMRVLYHIHQVKTLLVDLDPQFNLSQALIARSAILTMTGEVLYEQTIKPKYRIPKAATKIHGITNEMAKNCPSFPEIFDSIKTVLDGRIIVAYKAKFDMGMLQRTCGMYRLDAPECRWHCAMWAYYIYNGHGGRFPRLPNATHNSTGDCRALLALLQQMAAGVGGNYYGLTN